MTTVIERNAPAPSAHILRVSDSSEYFGLLALKENQGATIFAEGLETPCDDDLYVVSFEDAGKWQVFIGHVAQDHGLVQTPDGLILHSVSLRQGEPLHTAL